MTRVTTPPSHVHRRRPPVVGLLVGVVVSAWLLVGCGGTRRASTTDPMADADVSALGPAELQALQVRTETLAAANPTEPYYRYLLGEIHSRLGSETRAETLFMESVQLDPYYAPALSALSKAYFRAGRHEDAIQILEPACDPANQPDGVPQELVAGLALHYDAVDEIDLAAEAVERLLREGADWSRCGSAIAYVQLRAEGGSAREVAELALESDERSAINLNNYGITRAQAGDPEGARHAFLEAVKGDPDLAGPYYNLAILDKYYFLNDEKAAEWFSANWRRSQEDPDALVEVFRAEAEPGRDSGSNGLAAREDAP